MQSENRFFDDLAKLVNGAAGTVAGMTRELETNARERAKEWIGGVDFVSREEFNAVKAMAAAAREEVELLKARLDALEGKSSEPVTKSVRAAKIKAVDKDSGAE
ncbi:accessory factor UbiK family protein [Sphingobium sp. AP49]|uniref:accessory factor UbiK family protein n=1 Tax=Sphingobium sp. AP49 TaxID=1144307 RepID=UPI00026EC8A7|nr:accessory factor UbiK family protein [Sphingobium sp. AP49]WHO40271.1 accessory factor UbiK family protein [Sphingobium sp. AP49]